MTDSDTTASWFAVAPRFTCDAVVPGLWQGDFPEGAVDWSRFDDVVTMTAEDVPAVRLEVGGLWLHVPIWDGAMENPDGVRTAAHTVAERVKAGKRVLVHCAAGLNRSGVVSARALMFLGLPVAEAIARVRAARGPFALSNPAFVAWLHEEAGESALQAGGHRPDVPPSPRSGMSPVRA